MGYSASFIVAAALTALGCAGGPEGTNMGQEPATTVGKADEPGAAVAVADVSAPGSFALQGYGSWTPVGSSTSYGTFPLTVSTTPYDYSYRDPWTYEVIHDVAMATVESPLFSPPIQILLAFDTVDSSILGGSGSGNGALARLSFTSKVPKGYSNTGIYFQFTLARSGKTEIVLSGTSVQRQ
jgi:hypothetical protein